MKGILKFITCGSVDDGKSTLIGRLLYDTGSVFEDQMQTLINESRQYGTQDKEIDYALLTDGLMSERDQGITIDVAYKYFDTKISKFIIADTPGHEQYTRNMATAASDADAAIILIDALKGITLQTKRHIYITTLFGVKNIVVAINKIDLVDYSQEIYTSLITEVELIIKMLNVKLSNLHYIPLSALGGDNVVTPSTNTIWYRGESLLEILDALALRNHTNDNGKFRFPVQYVNRPNAQLRAYAGTIASGKLCVGDKVKITPSLQSSIVKEIITYDGSLKSALKDEAMTVVFENELDISRGDIITLDDDFIHLSNSFDAFIVWMDENFFDASKKYELKIATNTTHAIVTIDSKKKLKNLNDISTSKVSMNDIAHCSIELDKKILLDKFSECKTTGSFILIDPYTNTISAAGVISRINRDKENIFVHQHTITKELREKRLHQKSFIIWLTGLSASGKSTIANALEKELYARGHKTYLLDGDNLRNTLNSDLGFTQKDREENIRRVAHIAQLMVDAGLIVITAFISPFDRERKYARSLVAEDEFIEVFVDTPLEICEQRDIKGLYKKARDKKIKHFTGISSPYERPEKPELILQDENVETSVTKLLLLLEEKMLFLEVQKL